MKREALLFYAVKYKGEYNKIIEAIRNEEPYELIKIDDHFCTIIDDDYPECFRLLQCPPIIFFYRGNFDLLKRKKVGIIGSREASKYGIEVTEWIVTQLSECVIVSGLANGIDGIAHRSAIKHNLPTIGVIGNGLDINYPAVNSSLQKYMEKYELVISEYPCLTSPKKHHFPFRNRLIAALSDCLIVTQAKSRSGTMITVDFALTLNKDIYTVPYPVFDENGTGCNELIQNGAMILLSEDEIMEKIKSV